MNLNSNPTTDQLKELLVKCDDNAANHSVYVTNDGEVHIKRINDKDVPAEWENESLYRFRLETMVAGNEYVGITAAEDDVWVERLFNALTENWTNGTRGYVDEF